MKTMPWRFQQSNFRSKFPAENNRFECAAHITPMRLELCQHSRILLAFETHDSDSDDDDDDDDGIDSNGEKVIINCQWNNKKYVRVGCARTFSASDKHKHKCIRTTTLTRKRPPYCFFHSSLVNESNGAKKITIFRLRSFAAGSSSFSFVAKFIRTTPKHRRHFWTTAIKMDSKSAPKFKTSTSILCTII